MLVRIKLQLSNHLLNVSPEEKLIANGLSNRHPTRLMQVQALELLKLLGGHDFSLKDAPNSFGEGLRIGNWSLAVIPAIMPLD
jgi:hypothetical protein